MTTPAVLPALRLSLFGEVTLTGNGRTIREFETKRATKMLVLLSCSRTGTMRRDELADLLWPDDFLDSTRLRLRQELSRLRRALGDYEHLLSSTAETITLDRNLVFNDWDLLANPTSICPDELLDILDGGYLGSWDDLWVIARRSEADRLRIEVAELVAKRLFESGSLAEAKSIAEAGQKLDRNNPVLREMLMNVFAKQGSLSQALMTYRLTHRNIENPPESTPAPVALPSVDPPDLPNVPHPIDRFHGRSKQVGDICRAMADPNNRLITISGIGGIGKTRLAIESAKSWTGPVGYVSYVEFTPEDKPDHYLVSKILHTNDIANPLQALRQRLDGQDSLLILDNLEVVEDAGSFVTTLLTTVPNARVLITSRKPMHIAGEFLVQLGPLEKIQEGLPMLEGLMGSQRLSVDQSRSLLEIVELCDGMPLTLRLAASRLRTMEPKELVDELSKDLSTLHSKAADLPERHQNLERMLELNLRTLYPREREFLNRIACFPAGVTRRIVRMMVGPDVDDILDRLLDSSLVWLNDEQSPLRFELLEPIRQYLRESQDEDEYKKCQIGLVDVVQDLVRSFDHVLTLPPDEQRKLYRQEAVNIRAATQIASEVDFPRALDIFYRTWNWELTLGRHKELEALSSRIIESGISDPAMLGQAYLAKAWCCSVTGDLKRTGEIALQSKELFEKAKLPAEALYAHLLSHECLRNYMDWEQAISIYSEIIEQASQLNDGLHATARVWRSRAFVHRGEWELAAKDVEYGYETAKVHQNLELQVAAGITLLHIHFEREDYTTLERRTQEMEVVHADLDNPYSWSILYRAWSRFELALGHIDRAAELSENSFRVFGFAENPFQVVEDSYIMARIHISRNNLYEAKESLSKIRKSWNKVLPRVQCPALAALAEYWQASGEPKMASEILGLMVRLRQEKKAMLVPVDRRYVDSVLKAIEPTSSDDLSLDDADSLFNL